MGETPKSLLPKETRFVSVTDTIQPFLIVLYPLLAFYIHNVHELSVDVLVSPVLILTTITAIISLILTRALRSKQRTAVAVTILSLAFFSYGQVALLARDRLGPDTYAVTRPFLYSSWLAGAAFITLATLRATRTIRWRNTGSRLVFWMTVGLYSVLVLQVGNYIRQTAGWKVASPEVLQPAEVSAGTKPDIYLLNFDRYGNRDMIHDFYGFDNSEFYAYLEREGFVTYPSAYANYPITDLSIASYLNMEYLDEMVREAGEDTQYIAYNPIMKRLTNHKVLQFLKSQGYTNIHIGSDWHGTKENPYADINYQFIPPQSPSMMVLALAETTMLRPFITESATLLGTPIFKPLSEKQVSRELKLDQLEKIKNLPDTGTPRFVFAHITLPHPKYLFDRNGNPQPDDIELKEDSRKLYVEQLQYTTQLIKSVVSSIKSKTENRAVILLVSDEGPYPFKGKDYGQNDLPWPHLSEQELRVKLGVLQALYLPGVDRNNLPPDLTLVNVLRVVFNQYLQYGSPLLPNQHYRIFSIYKPYRHIDVTSIITGGIGPTPVISP